MKLSGLNFCFLIPFSRDYHADNERIFLLGEFLSNLKSQNLRAVASLHFVACARFKKPIVLEHFDLFFMPNVYWELTMKK